MLSLFPRDVLYEVWDLTESVSEGLPRSQPKACILKYMLLI